MISPITAAANETGHTAAASQDRTPSPASTPLLLYTHTHVHCKIPINSRNRLPTEGLVTVKVDYSFQKLLEKVCVFVFLCVDGCVPLVAGDKRGYDITRIAPSKLVTKHAVIEAFLFLA